MTDLCGYAKKSTANGDTRSDLRLRLRRPEPRSTCGHHTGTTNPKPFVWTKTVDEIITKLMGKDFFEEFCREFAKEMNRL